MKFWPVPHLMVDSIYDVSAETLKDFGVLLLFIDVDNTIAPYSDNKVYPRLSEWIEGFRKKGIEPYILSNNRGQRPKIFAKALSVGYVGKARKPSTKTLKRVLEEKGVPRERAAIIGDQIYTDVLCARLAGMFSVLVRPLSLKNPLLAARYGLEMPFRIIYKLRQRRSKRKQTP
ncbi:MAG TPA: YqeG family HAD IIIA-type phosphatase [Clostridiales bacterium]|nr:YqeG family HAD IIIA-type phosphatase [Clostridiales bacterium]